MWTVCEFSQNKGNENKIKKRSDAKKRKTPGNIENFNFNELAL